MDIHFLESPENWEAAIRISRKLIYDWRGGAWPISIEPEDVVCEAYIKSKNESVVFDSARQCGKFLQGVAAKLVVEYYKNIAPHLYEKWKANKKEYQIAYRQTEKYKKMRYRLSQTPRYKEYRKGWLARNKDKIKAGQYRWNNRNKARKRAKEREYRKTYQPKTPRVYTELVKAQNKKAQSKMRENVSDGYIIQAIHNKIKRKTGVRLTFEEIRNSYGKEIQATKAGIINRRNALDKLNPLVGHRVCAGFHEFFIKRIKDVKGHAIIICTESEEG